jgi:hypothetical protein
MSNQSKITAAELPRSSPTRSSTNRFSFADLAPTAENAATLPSESSHPGDTLMKWFPTPNSPGFKVLANCITSVCFKADLFGDTESAFSVAMLLGPV